MGRSAAAVFQASKHFAVRHSTDPTKRGAVPTGLRELTALRQPISYYTFSHQLKEERDAMLLTSSHRQGCPSFCNLAHCSTAPVLSSRRLSYRVALLHSQLSPASTCIHAGHHTVTITSYNGKGILYIHGLSFSFFRSILSH